MRNKGNRVWYNVMLIALLIVMDIYGDYVYNGLEDYSHGFTYPLSLYASYWLSYILVYWINYRFVCPRFLPQKRIFAFVIACFSLFFIFAGIRYFLDEIVLFQLMGKHNYNIEGLTVPYYVFDNSYRSINAILYSTSMFLLFRFIDNRDRLHQLEIEHKKSELSLLKAQLEPHFLFNTLNAFYTDLIDSEPKTAKSIHRLSELLRYVTYEAKGDFMPLDKELAFIDNYLALNRTRLEDTLSLDYKVEGPISARPIPSMLLIHFVENVFKHGVVTDKKAPAQINVRILEHSLEIETQNKVGSSEKYSAEGIGQNNLSRRLDALFPGGHEFKEGMNGEFYQSFLRIPFNQVAV